MKQIITVSVCLLVVQVPLDQPESAKTWQETNVQIWYLRFEEKNARKSKTESESRHVWRNVNKNYRSKIIHKPTTPSPLAVIRCNGEQRKRKTFSLTHTDTHVGERTDDGRLESLIMIVVEASFSYISLFFGWLGSLSFTYRALRYFVRIPLYYEILENNNNNSSNSNGNRNRNSNVHTKRFLLLFFTFNET